MSKDKETQEDQEETSVKLLYAKLIETEGDHNKTLGNNESDPDGLQHGMFGTDLKINTTNKDVFNAGLESDVSKPWTLYSRTVGDD